MARVEKVPLKIRTQGPAGTAGVSECVPTTLVRPGLCVRPSRLRFSLSFADPPIAPGNKALRPADFRWNPQ